MSTAPSTLSRYWHAARRAIGLGFGRTGDFIMFRREATPPEAHGAEEVWSKGGLVVVRESVE